MAKLVKVFKEEVPALTLVGKVYHMEDRDEHGSFSAKWGEWFKNGWFSRVKTFGTPGFDGAYVGAMRMNGDVPEYWIGMMMEAADELPGDFSSLSIPAWTAGVAWIKGRDDAALYSMHEACMKAFAEEGLAPAKDAWYIERYACPRFTTPDENGEVILDYLVSVKAE